MAGVEGRVALVTSRSGILRLLRNPLIRHMGRGTRELNLRPYPVKTGYRLRRAGLHPAPRPRLGAIGPKPHEMKGVWGIAPSGCGRQPTKHAQSGTEPALTG